MRSRPLFFIKVFITAAAVLLLGVYFFYQSKTFLLGPRITVVYPENGQTLSNAFVKIKGVALNTDTLFLNNRVILTDAFGSFEEGLLLAVGYNIIELTAKDKFGRVVDKKLEVVLK